MTDSASQTTRKSNDPKEKPPTRKLTKELQKTSVQLSDGRFIPKLRQNF